MQTLRLPALGETMEWGIIIQWFVGEGAEFDAGDPLYEVENEKVTLSVDAVAAGTLLRITAPSGEELDVGTLIAVVGEPGEAADAAAIDELMAAESGPTVELPSTSPAAPQPTGSEATRRPGRVRAAPKARNLARDRGIDLAAIEGTGPRGMITVDDIEAAAMEAGAPQGPAIRSRTRLTGVPRAMARRMAESWREIPHFTETIEVDAGALLARRAAAELSLNGMLIGAVVDACVGSPDVNVSLQGDTLVEYGDVNVAIAVDTPAGLVAPVIHRAQDLSPQQIDDAAKELAGRARLRELTPADLEGATITLSNLGMQGVDWGTPVVTHPQAAIVFTGAIRERPTVVDGAVVVRPIMVVTAAFDHRAVDGATGARFLGALRDALTVEPLPE